MTVSLDNVESWYVRDLPHFETLKFVHCGKPSARVHILFHISLWPLNSGDDYERYVKT
jgi:hypothetical protein